jgi:hypothetical protein
LAGDGNRYRSTVEARSGGEDWQVGAPWLHRLEHQALANEWSCDEERAKDGDRMIISNLVGCPEGDPLREAYWALVYDPKIELLSEGKLQVSGQGHQAVLIRCRWERVRETLPGGGISDMMRCLPIVEDG